MGIALLTLSGLFQGFANFSRPARQASTSARPLHALRMVRPSGSRAPITSRPVSSIGVARSACAPRPAALRVLRVLRECDAGQAPGEAGRLVISGRMADVCAELDRLVAREAAAALKH